jgi:hypothetical protein
MERNDIYSYESAYYHTLDNNLIIICIMHADRFMSIINIQGE